MSAAAEPRPHVDAAHSILELVRPGLDRLERTLGDLAAVDDPVLAPMLATVLPGSGKRLRPALSLVIGRIGRADAEVLNHMAVGVELLHTASLVHDDVVDESDTRRGSATLYTRVGNALAVLVGDYLFSQAARECVTTGDLRVVGLFARTLSAMARGQVDEANAQKQGHTWQTLTREQYYSTIRGKTASLFVLACEGSALLGGLGQREVEALRPDGEKIGLAFQVVDDILDFTGTEQVLGKPVGSDLRQGTITLPVILLRDRELADGRFSQVFELGEIEEQVRLVQESGALDAAYAEADHLVRTAQEALAVLPPGKERYALEDLASYVTQRRV
jgi:geranylgeranyl pyrophosphate synthase